MNASSSAHSAAEHSTSDGTFVEASGDVLADWPELIARLRDGWLTVVVAGLTAVIVATGLWWLDGERYTARATLALTRPDATLAFDERFRAAPVDPSFPYRIGSIRTYPELALTDDIALRVLAALGDRAPAEWGAEDLLARVRALAAAEGTLLVVEARDDDAMRAADIANTWAEVFSTRMEFLLGSTAKAGEGDAGGLSSARATARAALKDAESALESFHASEAIDARAAELDGLEMRYRGVLERRDRLDDVARDANRIAERLESGGAIGADAALALLILRSEALSGAGGSSGGGAIGADTGGLTLRFDAGTGGAPSAADLKAIAQDASDARDSAAGEIEALPARLAEARASFAAASHTRDDLERDRDLAGESLQALGRREAEVEAAAATSRPELRLAAAAVPPVGIDLGPLLRRILTALIVGALAGAALALRAPRVRGAGNEASSAP